MIITEERRGRHRISTDRASLDVDLIHAYLTQTSYWARGRSRRTVDRSIETSLCFGVFEGSRQVGFARVVTDYATFAWLCDVFIVEPSQGQGLGKWLIECVVAHPELQGLKFFLLATRDAHDLYRQYGGFEVVDTPELIMARARKST